MPPAARRPDLAAMMVPLGRHLMAAELPVLRRHDLSMWAYIVLLNLGAEPTRTQAALAQAIGADKTRIIGYLDELTERGLIRRTPDPDDRRARLLAITPAGQKVRDAVQTDIQANEERLLARLSVADRRGLLRGLQILAALRPEEITGE
jgi:DNA-binding MarR family transcriptional regulator